MQLITETFSFLILLISSKQPETVEPHNAENFGYVPFVYVFFIMYLSYL